MPSISELFNKIIAPDATDSAAVINGLHVRLTRALEQTRAAQQDWFTYDPQEGYFDANMRPIGPQPDELALIGALATYALETGIARDSRHLLAQIELVDIRAQGNQGALDAIIGGAEALRLQHGQIRVMGEVGFIPHQLIAEYETNKAGLQGIGRALVEGQPLLTDVSELLSIVQEQVGIKPSDTPSAQALKANTYVAMGRRSPFAH